MKNSMDHRQIADEMELYCLNEEVGSGLPIWLPKGEVIRRELMNGMEILEKRDGFQRVSSPSLAKAGLYEKSGHLKLFRANMFPEMSVSEDSKGMFLRPMNCPHHHLIFAMKPRSYRELPFRIAEFGNVYRFENSGALCGLIRARSLCQNDAHIYVLPSQVREELKRVIAMNLYVLKNLGLGNVKFRLSGYDKSNPEEFHGVEADWKMAENLLREAMGEFGISVIEAPGEAAFYGPKIDIQYEREESKEESIGSIQLDFNSGQNFSLRVVNSNGEVVVPWIIHRAPMGSFERMVAILLEHYQGRLPGWLAPIQIAILPVAERHQEHAQLVHNRMLAAGIRSELISPQGSLGMRMKKLHRLRPFSRLVLGDAELFGQSKEPDWKLVMREEEQVCRASELVSFIQLLVERPWSDD